MTSMSNPFSRFLSGLLRFAALLAVSGWVAGCGSGANEPASGAGGANPPALAGHSGGDRLRIGDLVKVSFSGTTTPPVEQEERIKDDGMINLQYIGPVKAEGKSPGDLQREIQGLYVPKYYRRLTVTLKTDARFFYVDGEVRSPGRMIYAEEITILRAIAASGGFNDFAARTRVQLVRASGEKLKIDAKKAKDDPSLDVVVLPGDRIFVPRRSPLGR